MTEFLSVQGGPGPSVLAGILDRLREQGVPQPQWVVVDDGRHEWLRHVASLPVEHRRRGVIAAASDQSLVDAVRLEVGGGCLMPPSTPAVEAACEAAADASAKRVITVATAAVVEAVVARATELRLVGWIDRPLWCRQLGTRRMADRLLSVAEHLECAPVLCARPALLVADRSAREIEAAWCESAPRGCATSGSAPAVVDVVRASLTLDSATGIEEALRALDSAGRKRPTVVAHAVHELPSGRLVGWWRSAADGDDPGPGFVAVPRQLTATGHIWEVRLDAGSTEVRDHHLVDDVDPACGPVLRIPGWVGDGMRRGSPSGILVERLAERAHRLGVPLWAPSVDSGALPFLLGLPGRIWVDGPAGPG